MKLLAKQTVDVISCLTQLYFNESLKNLIGSEFGCYLYHRRDDIEDLTTTPFIPPCTIVSDLHISKLFFFCQNN